MKLATLLATAALTLSVATSTNSIVSAQDPSSPLLNRIRPKWVADQGFWYTKPLANGSKEWVWVDPTNKKILRASSFEELEKLAGIPLRTPNNNGGPVRIEPSETQDESRIDLAIRNGLDEAVELFWVDFQGNPQPYGRLAPGESRTQSTFAGHSWLATDEKRNPIWTAIGSSAGETLEIQKMQIEPIRDFPRRGRSRRQNNPPPKSPNAQPNPWQVVREEHQLRFTNNSGETILDTSSLSEAAGSQSLRYDQPVFWSPDYRYAFTPVSYTHLTLPTICSV